MRPRGLAAPRWPRGSRWPTCGSTAGDGERIASPLQFLVHGGRAPLHHPLNLFFLCARTRARQEGRAGLCFAARGRAPAPSAPSLLPARREVRAVIICLMHKCVFFPRPPPGRRRLKDLAPFPPYQQKPPYHSNNQQISILADLQKLADFSSRARHAPNNLTFCAPRPAFCAPP
jgi:hypothetical protein